jgi:hypothetical protein
METEGNEERGFLFVFFVSSTVSVAETAVRFAAALPSSVAAVAPVTGLVTAIQNVSNSRATFFRRFRSRAESSGFSSRLPCRGRLAVHSVLDFHAVQQNLLRARIRDVRRHFCLQPGPFSNRATGCIP